MLAFRRTRLVKPPDPEEVRRLVAEALERVRPATAGPPLPTTTAPGATAPSAPTTRPARVVDWTKPAPGDVRPLAEFPAPPSARPRRAGRETDAAPDPARTVALGGDHGGFALKEMLRRYLREELRYAVIDCGTHSTEAVDYPDIARTVGETVAQGRAARGIVIDGAGIGSTMAANRIPGVRCALCHDVKTVLNSREHNDANVLALGSGIVNPGLARQMVRTWLTTPFAGGRHARRVAKIMELERMLARAAERPE